MKRVFISHPFAGDPERNRKEVEKICKEIVATHEEIIPISPLHMFSFFKVEAENYREEIMSICFDLIDFCDEVWIYGESKGCRREWEYAVKKNKEVVKKY